MTSKFTEAQFDKAGFLGLIQEFLNKVDELAPTGTASKKTGLDLENAMNEILQNFKYVCSVSFGYGKFANSPSITFAPIKILNNDLVNSDILSPTKGAYIYFCYFYKKNEIILDIGYSDEKPPKCEAKNSIDKHRNNKEWIYEYNRKDFEKIKDKIAENFLYLVDEFNQIPLEDFKIEGQEMANSNENSRNSQNGKSGESKNPPLNQILYGPPGTGKTYSTIDRALQILGYEADESQAKDSEQDKVGTKITLDYAKIKSKLQEVKGSERAKGLDLGNLENLSVENQSDKRKLAKLLFDYYKNERQIEFVTFHQSFSYEEFVEGIKPVIATNSQTSDNVGLKEMTYKIEPGIFKKICYKALEVSRQKMEYKNNFYDTFKSMLNNGKTINGVKFENSGNEFKSGDTLIYRNTIKHYLDEIDGASKDELDDIIGQRYPEHSPKYRAVLEYYLDEISKFKEKPYILIIDEINRGNISKILGELITLIEPSKRINASEGERARGVGDEGLRVKLPYSKEIFGVPSNLYIIGTMNTADRSIALLDTALRRRFEFVEMMPDCKELQKIRLVEDAEKPEQTSIDKDAENAETLFKILTAMNQRIEFLLDREHTIGHAFFFEKAICKKEGEMAWYELSLDSLKEIFAKKIIPLLQEYFYDDYVKIQAVLNDNGMIEAKEKSSFGNLFKPKFSDLDSEKIVYEITNSGKWQAENFIKIYE